MLRLRPRPPSLAGARRAPESTSPARSDRRTRRRCGRSRSSNSRHERPHTVVILDPRLELEARARIHRPRLHRLDRLAHVLGREPAGQHDPAFGGTRALEGPRILLAPRAVADPRGIYAAAEQAAAAAPP